MKHVGFINYLKLRGAVAQVGKDAPVLSIDPELEPTGLTGGGYKYGYTGPNRSLKPEMTTSVEAGVEARFWNDRLNADFTPMILPFLIPFCSQSISIFKIMFVSA